MSDAEQHFLKHAIQGMEANLSKNHGNNCILKAYVHKSFISFYKPKYVMNNLFPLHQFKFLEIFRRQQASKHTLLIILVKEISWEKTNGLYLVLWSTSGVNYSFLVTNVHTRWSILYFIILHKTHIINMIWCKIAVVSRWLMS